MMNPQAARPASRIRRLFWAVLLQGFLVAPAFAQSSATDAHTPPSMAPGAPAGSYALSGFDNINLYNGRLNFRLPLLRLGGRGGAGYTMTLPIEQRWNVSHWYEHDLHSPGYNSWEGLEPGYGPGVLQGRQTHEGCGSGGPYPEGQFQTGSMTTLTFTAPDGTQYELRDTLTGGNVQNSTCCCYYQNHADGASRGTVFKSVEGPVVTFVSDATIYDWSGNVEGGPHLIYPDGHLIFSDGTRYRIDAGKVTWIRDRNGNRLTFTYTGDRVGSVTDSLGRVVSVEYDVNDPTYGLCDRISFSGFGGAARKIWVAKTTLGNVLRSGYSLQTYAQLFPGLSGSLVTQHNPGNMVSSVWLPDGRRYQFQYNSYGELARAALPTGGAFEYDWGLGEPGSCVPAPEIFRRVTERRVYRAATTLESRMTYAVSNYTTVVSSLAPDGTLLARQKHYFHGANATCGGSLGYAPWDEGKEYRTEEFASNGVTVLRRTEQTWQQTPPGWYPGLWWTAEPVHNPRVVTTVTTVEPGGANLVTKRTAINPQTGAVGFDQFNNQTDNWEYDYGAGAPPARPVRHTHTDYLTTNAVNGVDYTSNTVHLLSLPRAQQIYSVNASTGAETLVAQSETKYDETALLPWYGTVQGWADPGAARGNPTKSRRWLDTSNTWVETRAQFDQVGNATKSWDAKNNVSEVIYSATYHRAYPTQTTSPVPDPAGLYGSTAALVTTVAYDLASGLATSVTDANGKTTTLSYADEAGVLDKFNRLRKVVRPGGTAAGGGGQTLYSYGDTPGNLFVRTRTTLDATRSTDSYQYFDGLGRPFRSMQYENQDAAEPWVTVDTEYDALGRVRRTSLPYRAAAGAALFSTNKWAETTYDALGRVKTVTTKPDNAVVTTAYRGNLVQATDQAGKSRRSETDALGRLTAVVEFTRTLADETVVENPLASDYVTSYRYDVLSNLRKVDQGGQLRFFAYDSLGRLVRVKHPEQGVMAADADFPALTDSTSGTANSQWSAGYKYDANGNLIKRKDARGVTAAYAYDALNRGTTVLYSDATPDVTRYYDGAVLGKGRAWKSEAAGVARATVSEYDSVGRPEAYSQQFWVSGAWGASYAVTRAYDLAGNVTSQTYPSGRSVASTYDAAGRLASFAGNLGDSAQRSYSTGVAYDELGGMRQERFGTATPVYNKRRYNERGQLSEVRVGTTANDDGWNRGAILNAYSLQPGTWTQSQFDNNGSLRKQMVYVPNGYNPDTDGWWETAFFYDYDALNRLMQAREVRGGANYWVQDFDYDRWGNRTVNAANTFNAPEPQFTASATTNRLSPPAGFTMSYDTAGNLTNDTYTGGGTRTFDAEGRMTTAQFVSGQAQTATYTYDADGHRVKRDVGASAEVWQIYGIDGELLAEYAAGVAASSPQKEYGYRGGELLVTLEAGQRVNVALSSNGATAAASSSVGSNRPPLAAINGDHRGLNGAAGDPATGSWWADASPNTFPDWLEVTFPAARAIDEVSVFTLQDNHPAPAEPTEAMTFTTYGLTAFDVQYWTGAAWANVPGGVITGNNKVWRKLTFAAVTTQKIRVVARAASADGYSRIVEVEAWGGAAEARWLIPDHLGTPRMIVDAAGQLSGVSRHDYLPFGEQLPGDASGRTAARGYAQPDGVRQQFTGYERDAETGLDFAQARYYAGPQGRFTGIDPLLASGRAGNPQTWNRYAYALNSPLRYTDPTGLAEIGNDVGQTQNTPPPPPPQREPEPESGNIADQMHDLHAALLFGDCGAITRGSDTRGGTEDNVVGNHFYTADGVQHTTHIYGDESGNKIVGLFIPQGFTKVVYEGGTENQVIATNPETKQVLVFAHVAGVNSQADVDRNINSGKTNSVGSTYLGRIGGPGGGEAAGYKHSHITLYNSAEGRKSIRDQVYNPRLRFPGTGRITNFSGYGNIRSLVRQNMVRN